MVNKIQSSAVGTYAAVEKTLNVMPTTPLWQELEPTSFNDFGVTTSATAREVLVRDRQLRKGVVTDITAAAGYSTELTATNMSKMFAGFMFAKPREKAASNTLFARDGIDNETINGISAVSATNITVALGGTTGVVAKDIVIVEGGTNVLNRNVAVAVSAVSTTALTVAALYAGAPTLGIDGASTGRIRVVGHAFGAGELNLTATAAAATLTSTAAGYSFLTAGLSVGEWVFVGGDGSLGAFAEVQPFYGRISAVTATTLVFDSTTAPVVNTAVNTKQVPVFYGTFYRNEENPTLIRRYSWVFERQLGNDGNGIQAEYITGCVPNEIGIAIEQKGIVTSDVSFVGMNSTYRTGAEGLIAGTRVNALEEAPFNTSTDVYRQRLAVQNLATMNTAAMHAFAQSVNISINNNVSADGAVGVLGGFDTSVGKFTVTGTVTAYFTSIAALEAIKCNCTVGIDVIIAHSNTGKVFDIPAVTLEGGGLTIEDGQSITIELNNNAFKSRYGFTMGITDFPYLPTVAMPPSLSDCDCT